MTRHQTRNGRIDKQGSHGQVKPLFILPQKTAEQVASQGPGRDSDKTDAGQQQGKTADNERILVDRYNKQGKDRHTVKDPF